MTDWQRRKAATLTAPGTWLAEWSAASAYGIRGKDRWPTTVKRIGDGGPRTYGHRDPSVEGAYRVYFGDDFAADTAEIDDVAMVTPARTLLDLTDRVSERTARRQMRDALRLGVVQPIDLQLQVARHAGRRGIVVFRDAAHEYGSLGLHRSRSDAEALALSLLEAAGVERPEHNRLVAGCETDFLWVKPGVILELDGPQYHLFVSEDARKQALWEQAGWVVRRLWTDVVYDQPHVLLSEATRPVTEEERAIAAATTGPEDVVRRLGRRQPPATNVRKWSL
ncbi:MAG: DUF559 domain-containing protein [Solirubrobacteraceae bacterium]|nr:DUF559 domain-containing protein [Solirubrobacteraceae bacterium]